MKSLLLFPTVSGARANVALVALRVIAGIGIMLHGVPKIRNPFGWMGPDSGMPGVLQALAALAEFGGGLAWILGVLTPLASFGVLATMAVAVIKHVAQGHPFVGKGGSYEGALLYLGIALVFMLRGPGRYSLDALLVRVRGQQRAESAT
ncbi:MAG: DoxX family protein [Myxococcaceae bacterium]